MMFDPYEPEIDDTIFGGQEYSDTVYGEYTEDIPSNAQSTGDLVSNQEPSLTLIFLLILYHTIKDIIYILFE